MTGSLAFFEKNGSILEYSVHSNSKLSSFGNNEAGILLFTLDIHGIITHLDGKLVDLLGFKKKDLLGISFFDITAEKNSILEKIQSSVLHHKSSSVFSAAGKNFHCYYTTSKNFDGVINGIVGAVIDISDQKKKEDLIKKKNEQISILYEAGKDLSRTLDLSALYETMYKIIKKVAYCDLMFVSSYNSKKKEIRYEFIKDGIIHKTLNFKKIPPIHLAPKGYGILSEVIRNGESVLLNDYQKNLVKVKTSHQIKVRTKQGEKNVKLSSAFMVPIKLNNKVVGAVQIYSREKNAYTIEQLKLVETLMQPLSIAINNAILYQNAAKEIKERKFAENKLQDNLSEKEMLLKELNHRVKNNLQVITSLISLQSKYVSNEQLLQLFKESQSRIQAISIIHDLLYTSTELNKINFEKYIESIAGYIFRSYSVDNKNIELNINASNISLGIDEAVPCGLIINELITNCIKHAFPGMEKGRIFINLKNEGKDSYKLEVIDNGIGISNLTSTETFGMRIIKCLTQQINGNLSIKNNQGTEIRIKFKNSFYKQRL